MKNELSAGMRDLPGAPDRQSRASTGRHTGRDRNDSCTTMLPTTQQLPNPIGFGPFAAPS